MATCATSTHPYFQNNTEGNVRVMPLITHSINDPKEQTNECELLYIRVFLFLRDQLINELSQLAASSTNQNSTVFTANTPFRSLGTYLGLRGSCTRTQGNSTQLLGYLSPSFLVIYLPIVIVQIHTQFVTQGITDLFLSHPASSRSRMLMNCLRTGFHNFEGALPNMTTRTVSLRDYFPKSVLHRIHSEVAPQNSSPAILTTHPLYPFRDSPCILIKTMYKVVTTFERSEPRKNDKCKGFERPKSRMSVRPLSTNAVLTMMSIILAVTDSTFLSCPLLTAFIAPNHWQKKEYSRLQLENRHYRPAPLGSFLSGPRGLAQQSLFVAKALGHRSMYGLVPIR
ncbi:hypothetical protein SODALDRAFT_360597 [Sodiomyces alkalinus F11]|uniref:Uncharacterized protein n=1 Tax=Sodiomyces alkalinus (strain CBS 110278 / VKM F-3762 / F11) TaxID=1314773 RepID=A0A3N2PUS2_SODAK|nr:hypothetical protein SODALDRAFT_360597 [Sodiomyces alkalinus F11]ROT38253.1 hypothetical protein SODALDRAFT_360597 [Sodiomyces alkalinus F11]